MKLAKSNTDKNLETCGILAGSLVSTPKFFYLWLNPWEIYLFLWSFYYNGTFLCINLLENLLLIATEKPKILYHGSHYSKARIDLGFGKTDVTHANTHNQTFSCEFCAKSFMSSSAKRQMRKKYLKCRTNSLFFRWDGFM